LTSRGKAVSDGAVFFLLDHPLSVRIVAKMRGELKKLEVMLVELDDEMVALKREKGDFENLSTNRQHEIATLQKQLRVREEEIQKLRSADRKVAKDLDAYHDAYKKAEQVKKKIEVMLVERDHEMATLKKQKEDLENLNTNRQHEITNLHSQLKVREEDIQKHRSADRKVAKELEMYHDAYSKAEQARRTLHEETVTLRRQVADTDYALQQLQHEHASNLHMLKLRTTELKVAQKILNTADSIADADVTRMVEKLNNQILDRAAHLADKLVHSVRRVAKVDAAELERAQETIREPLGDQFVSLFRASRGTNDPEMALQIALQASLTYFSYATISQWHQDANLDGFLKGLYYVVQQSGMSITFGKKESY
jgi:chromosome segregation ATPase